MSSATRHVVRETALSGAINGVISTGFYVAVFGGLARVPVWGPGNYVFDFLPQSFAIGFMAALVPCLMFRRAMADGRFGAALAAVLPYRVVASAALSGLASLVLGTALWAAVLWSAGVDTIASTAALVLKVVYGASLGALVTAVNLRLMLR